MVYRTMAFPQRESKVVHSDVVGKMAFPQQESKLMHLWWVPHCCVCGFWCGVVQLPRDQGCYFSMDLSLC